MATYSLRDVPVMIKSLSASSERRITQSWTIAMLKTKLEPITGISPTYQRLVLKIPGLQDAIIEANDEDAQQVAAWNLQAGAEIEVTDSRPNAPSGVNFNELSNIPKYTMPDERYASLPSSVLAWKKNNKLGRFDPNAADVEGEKIVNIHQAIESKHIVVGKRCQLGLETSRRGEIAFVGEVEEIPGLKGPWVGVILDEPTGRNDGSVGGKRYFQCPMKRGVFVRPDRLEVGAYASLNHELDSDLEEI